MIFLSAKAGIRTVPPSAVMTALTRFGPTFEFQRPLFQAAAQEVLDLIAICDTEANWPARQLRLSERPTVVLIEDDPGCPSGAGGHAAFRCAPKIGGWCRSAMIHAAGGRTEHYIEAVRATLKTGRLALIETTTKNASGWHFTLQCPLTLLIMPHEGDHPIEAAVH